MIMDTVLEDPQSKINMDLQEQMEMQMMNQPTVQQHVKLRVDKQFMAQNQ